MRFVQLLASLGFGVAMLVGVCWVSTPDPPDLVAGRPPGKYGTFTYLAVDGSLVTVDRVSAESPDEAQRPAIARAKPSHVAKNAPLIQYQRIGESPPAACRAMAATLMQTTRGDVSPPPAFHSSPSDERRRRRWSYGVATPRAWRLPWTFAWAWAWELASEPALLAVLAWAC